MTSKRAFQVPTTAHFNAAPNQAYEAKQWLNQALTEIASKYKNPNSGPVVTVIIEVIE